MTQIYVVARLVCRSTPASSERMCAREGGGVKWGVRVHASFQGTAAKACASTCRGSRQATRTWAHATEGMKQRHTPTNVLTRTRACSHGNLKAARNVGVLFSVDLDYRHLYPAEA